MCVSNTQSVLLVSDHHGEDISSTHCSSRWNAVSLSPWAWLENRQQPRLTTVPTIYHCTLIMASAPVSSSIHPSFLQFGVEKYVCLCLSFRVEVFVSAASDSVWPKSSINLNILTFNSRLFPPVSPVVHREGRCWSLLRFSAVVWGQPNLCF